MLRTIIFFLILNCKSIILLNLKLLYLFVFLMVIEILWVLIIINLNGSRFYSFIIIYFILFFNPIKVLFCWNMIQRILRLLLVSWLGFNSIIIIKFIQIIFFHLIAWYFSLIIKLHILSWLNYQILILGIYRLTVDIFL